MANLRLQAKQLAGGHAMQRGGGWEKARGGVARGTEVCCATQTQMQGSLVDEVVICSTVYMCTISYVLQATPPKPKFRSISAWVVHGADEGWHIARRRGAERVVLVPNCRAMSFGAGRP